MATFSREEISDEIMAKSRAGSTMRIPPAMFRKTSLSPKGKLPRFSKTAKSMDKRRKSNPVDDRWGLPYTALVTKACVSISKGRAPSRVAAMALPLNSSSFCESSNSEGLATSRSPVACIS